MSHETWTVHAHPLGYEPAGWMDGKNLTSIMIAEEDRGIALMVFQSIHGDQDPHALRDAHHICHCVNSHDALVEAGNLALRHLYGHPTPESVIEIRQILGQALAAAQKEEE